VVHRDGRRHARWQGPGRLSCPPRGSRSTPPMMPMYAPAVETTDPC
jgi:hypothetical protein